MAKTEDMEPLSGKKHIKVQPDCFFLKPEVVLSSPYVLMSSERHVYIHNILGVK